MLMNEAVNILRVFSYGNDLPSIQILPSHTDYSEALGRMKDVACGSIMDWPGLYVTISFNGKVSIAPSNEPQEVLTFDWSLRSNAMVEMKAIVLRTFDDEPCVVIAANCLDERRQAAFFEFWSMVANIGPVVGTTSGHYRVRFRGSTEPHLLSTLPANLASMPEDAAKKLIAAIKCGAKPTYVRVIMRTHK